MLLYSYDGSAPTLSDWVRFFTVRVTAIRMASRQAKRRKLKLPKPIGWAKEAELARAKTYVSVILPQLSTRNYAEPYRHLLSKMFRRASSEVERQRLAQDAVNAAMVRHHSREPSAYNIDYGNALQRRCENGFSNSLFNNLTGL